MKCFSLSLCRRRIRKLGDQSGAEKRKYEQSKWLRRLSAGQLYEQRRPEEKRRGQDEQNRQRPECWYKDMDFIVAKYGSSEEASSYLARSTKEFGVLLDPDELEEMANDSEVRKQYTDQLDEAVEQLKDMKDEVQLEEGDVLHLGVAIDPYGVKEFFADIEKANSNLHSKQTTNRIKAQKEFETRLAKKAEKKKADQKAAAKKTAETKAEQRAEEKKEAERLAAEKLTSGDGTVDTVQRVHVTGSTVEELLQNIQNVDWSRVPVREQAVHGGRFDYTV